MMVIILDLSTGQKLPFKTRNQAAEFLSVSLPTLRKWLDYPFFCYKRYLITDTKPTKEPTMDPEEERLSKLLKSHSKNELKT